MSACGENVLKHPVQNQRGRQLGSATEAGVEGERVLLMAAVVPED